MNRRTWLTSNLRHLTESSHPPASPTAEFLNAFNHINLTTNTFTQVKRQNARIARTRRGKSLSS